MLRDPTTFSPTISDTSTAVASSYFPSPTSVVKPPRAPKRLYLHDFKQIRGLGAGGCGSVYLVKHIPTGKEFALKAIDKRFANHKIVLREQQVMKDIATVDTKLFAGLVGSFHNHRFYYMLMVRLFFLKVVHILSEFRCQECHGGGDLANFVYRWGNRMPKVLVKFYIAEMVSGQRSFSVRFYG